MSIPVSLDRLHQETERYGTQAYLLSTGADGRPHAVAAAVSWEDGRIVMSAGARTKRNVGERPLVSLLWPPPDPGGYSLIVDGTGEVSGGPEAGAVSVVPTRGVLHRPGPAPAARSSCVSDCVPLLES